MELDRQSLHQAGEILGYAGMGLALGSYWLVASRRIAPDSSTYRWMNIAAGVGLGFNGYVQDSMPAIALNTIWGGIAIREVIKSKLNQRR